MGGVGVELRDVQLSGTVEVGGQEVVQSGIFVYLCHRLGDGGGGVNGMITR